MQNITTSAPYIVQMLLLQLISEIVGQDPTIPDQYVYDRNSIGASTWIIQHNLNRYPQVTLIDEQGFEMDADIEFSTIDRVTVTFAQPTAGKAVLT